MSPKPTNQPSPQAQDKLYSFLARMETKYGVTVTNQPSKAEKPA